MEMLDRKDSKEEEIMNEFRVLSVGLRMNGNVIS